MQVLDLFSGIGGFSLGLKRAGMETVAFCEIDTFGRKILAKHWPGVPIHGDIHKLNGFKYRESVAVVCGGFPCQPFSVAGNRLGAEDDRALWPEMLRVIREVQPTWVIGENVAGIIRMELDNVLFDLEDLGYACSAFVIPACAVDAKHRRDRVWILGHTECQRRPSRGLYGRNNLQTSFDWSPDSLIPAGEGSEVMADTTSRGWGNTTHASVYRQGLSDSPIDGSRTDATRDAMADDVSYRPQLQADERELARERSGVHSGRPARWEPEPDVGRVAHGVSDRVDRLKGLGNAVVPQIVEQIGRAIMSYE